MSTSNATSGNGSPSIRRRLPVLQGRRLLFVDIDPGVVDELQRSGLLDELGADAIHPSVADAPDAHLARRGTVS